MKSVLIAILVGSCLVALALSKQQKQSTEKKDVDFISDNKKEEIMSGSGLSGDDDINEIGDQENADEDENVLSGEASASGKDLEKRKRVKPVRLMDSGCTCEGLTCECCLDIDFKIANGEACIDATALPDETALKFSFVWNGEEKKSVKKKLEDVVSFCYSFLPKAEGCVHIKDISLDSKKFGGCISLKVSALFFDETFDLGCFHTNVEKAVTEAMNDVPIRLRHGRWHRKKQRQIKAMKTTLRRTHKKNT